MSGVPEHRSRGLGRGLEVLIGGAGEAELLHLPVEAIHANPRQPRRRFEPEATAGLAASIKSQGVLQPVVSARFVHQRRAPVFASNAAMKPPFW